MPTKTRVLNGRNALKAGQLGERAVREILCLSEPDVEVKTMQLERRKFSVELTQLERSPDKVYVVCAYSRGVRTGRRKSNGKNGPRKYELTIEQAFARGLTFALVSTDKLLQLVKDGLFQVRWVEKNYRTKARFVALFELEQVMEQGEGYADHRGVTHLVYNAPELVTALKKENYVSWTPIKDDKWPELEQVI